eukprot:CAMPEP_0168436730 /NCGR_PEP_ID=MMETSP0228-20121227/41075_1 /TAXON_ID=133427 /ORGANISM="Protoceratium reticulatum, Strain CCCM 535 (=CCMP 1889)" /LENGTH=378 /DNA_ID=CAMNT_0008450933 /DNA_START=42 /DNA_END=1178 /DNA_ORIENTATION=-
MGKARAKCWPRSPAEATDIHGPLLETEHGHGSSCHQHAHGTGCTSELHQPGACHGFEVTQQGNWLLAHGDFDLADAFKPGSGEQRKRRQAMIGLGATALITSLVMALEVSVGCAVGSLALLSDGVHQLSDVALYLGLLLTVYLSGMEGSLATYSFGYHRVQVLGTLIALLLQYFATGLLVAEALGRLAAGGSHHVDGRAVFCVALVSLATNLVLLRVMPSNGHGHSHGSSDSSATGVARLHMLGDLVQGSACVLVGASIWAYPGLSWTDSLSTFIYASVVVVSTYGVLRDLVCVLMERTPPELQSKGMFDELAQIKGVIDVHCCHAWMLAPQKIAMSAHLHIEEDKHEEVLHAAQILLRHKYGIVHSTLQISDDEDLA